MRCDCCPLSNPEDVCPEAEGEYGIEHKDGVCGCRHPWNLVHKRDMMYADALGEMGLDMGIEMSFTPEELRAVTKMCKYMIGLGHKDPIKRRGKLYYYPYINRYFKRGGDELLDRACVYGIVNKQQDTILGVYYALTPTGLAWLGRRIGVVIHSEDGRGGDTK